MEELKPCPFCGGGSMFKRTARIENSSGGIGWKFVIECKKCGVRLPFENEIKIQLNENGEIKMLSDERIQAIESWNSRTD
jgi:restriction alleviation protein, Lar family